jgi:dTDP-4-dehydrorhamnose reductase
MKIAVLGAYGQLGRSIADIAGNYPQHDFIFTDIDTLDIVCSDAVVDFVCRHHPDVLINCVAYTAVDKAETDREQAMQLNADAVGNLIRIAAANNIFLVHISTDYVFDGKGYKPYREEDKTSPLSVYGTTKRKGEQLILDYSCPAVIIRTSWLYSEYGTNFVKTMLSLGLEREQLRIVNDQIGSPTYARDLAETILHIIAHKNSIQKPELFHFSNEGIASWYDFALEIMHLGNRQCAVLPIPTEQYPTAAQRPYYSVLDKQKIKMQFSLTIPYWKERLSVCVKNLLDETPQ